MTHADLLAERFGDPDTATAELAAPPPPEISTHEGAHRRQVLLDALGDRHRRPDGRYCRTD